MKNTFRILASSALFGALLAAVVHAVPVSGTLTAGNSSWSGSIEVVGAVTVPIGLTLTIAAGTNIRGTFAITANGPVKATGNVVTPVIFYETSLILAGTAQHDLQYVTIQNTAANAIAINGADVKLTHVLISDFGVNGVNVTGAGAKVVLDHCTIGAKSRLFTNTEAFSVNVSDPADVSISNSVLGFENKANQVGLAIRTAGVSSTVKVKYTLITGTRVGSSAGEIGILTGTPSDVKDIPNGDYHLWPFSAAIDAGDPAAPFAAEPAPNGGRANLGYYGNTAQGETFQFQIVTPNGSDSLTPGASTSIKWLGGKFLGAKKLDLSVDSGRTWSPISASTDEAGAGTHAWTVPSVKSPYCMVRISPATGALGMDQSDRVFTIGDTVAPGGTTGPLRDPTPFRCIPFAAYRDGQAPGGAEPTEAQVRSDLTLIKPFTREIRTYGSGLGSHGNSLPRITAEMGMKIHLGIWLDDTYAEDANIASINQGIALVTAGHVSIKSVIVGNEFLLRVRQAKKDEAAAEAKLIRYIKLVRAAIPASIPVSTGESYPDWLHASNALVEAVDVVYWHVHPWWEQKSIESAASHAFSVYGQMKARIARSTTPNKRQLLAETGWPSAATTGAAVGSEANQAKYLKDLHAWAHKEKFEYWFFANVDEKWKSNEGAVGGNWGMWKSDRTPKAVITGLTSLIPATQYWDNGGVTGIAIRPAARTLAAARPGTVLAIYDLQGRLLGTPGKAGRSVVAVPFLIKP